MRPKLIAGLSYWPIHGWLGLGLVTVFWILNWSLPGPRTVWGFFPLWLGYCLTVDAMVQVRKGSSLFTRSRLAYVGLFLASVPAWWLFELVNWRVQNWHYDGIQQLPRVPYIILTSLSFSTVMPSVFGTAELASTFGWIKRVKRGPQIGPTPGTLVAFFSAGWLMLSALLLWPRYFFAFVWISVYCVIEPLNVWLHHRSLADYTARRDWRPILSLWTGSLICGFFWEMWNFFSYPKWIYRVPFVDFLHIFEMPVLGYGGYLPFAMELFALYHLMVGVTRPGQDQDYIRILPGQDTGPEA